MYNPFGKKTDDVGRQIQAEKDMQKQQITAHGENEEQLILEQQRERAELTRWQQDLSSETEAMIHRLKNETLNERGEWTSQGKPLCSNECVWRLVAMLEPSTSKNLMMSKYEKDTILNTLRGLSDTIVTDVLLPNRKRYEIRMCDLSPIVRIFQTAATPTYFRALGGNEKDYLRGIRSDRYLHMEGEEGNAGKKRGLFG